MSPSFIPSRSRNSPRTSRGTRPSAFSAETLRMKTTAQVKRHLHQQVSQLAPDLSILETA